MNTNEQRGAGLQALSYRVLVESHLFKRTPTLKFQNCAHQEEVASHIITHLNQISVCPSSRSQFWQEINIKPIGDKRYLLEFEFYT